MENKETNYVCVFMQAGRQTSTQDRVVGHKMRSERNGLVSMQAKRQSVRQTSRRQGG